MKHLRKFESFEESIVDIKDTLLELKDDGWIVRHESFDIESDDFKHSRQCYQFSDEFLIFKRGDSGYFLDSVMCGLFKIDDLIDNIIRFATICESHDENYRVITSDGQYTMDITKKIHSLDKVNKDDILVQTHLHFKKSNNIDLNNVKFVSCQILK